MDSPATEANARLSAALTELIGVVRRSVEASGVDRATLEALAAQEEQRAAEQTTEREARHEQRRQDLQRKWQRY